MAISDKLTYLNTTKTLIREGLNNIGADLTTENTFRSYANALDTIYNNLPKVTGSGASITLNNTSKGKMELSLAPSELEQKTSPSPDYPQEVNVVKGYRNLFDKDSFTYDNYYYNDSGQLIEGTNSGRSTNLINVKPSADYYLSGFTITGASNDLSTIQRIYFFDNNQNFISRTNSFNKQIKYNFTTPTNCSYISFQCITRADVSGGITRTILSDLDTIQLTEGTSGLPYVPYGSNYVTLDIKGKNLFDKDNANTLHAFFNSGATKISLSAAATIVYVPCEPNKTYTISKTPGTRFWFGYTKETPADKVQVYGISGMQSELGEVKEYYTTTTDSEAKYLVSFVYNSPTDTNITLNEMLASIQIEQGSTATSYEPYTEKQIPLKLGNIEYCKIGDYSDEFIKTSGEWYLKKNIDKVVLNGSEDWDVSNLTDDYLYFISNTYDSVLNVTSNNLGIMNNFSVLPGWDTQTNGFTIRSNTSHLRIRFDKTKLSNISTKADAIASFKAWLSNNLTILYYVLATPTFIKITDTTLIEQLDNIYQGLKSYANQTNISQFNAGLPFIISASALQDLSTL